jgi:hypothetical protein
MSTRRAALPSFATPPARRMIAPRAARVPAPRA